MTAALRALFARAETAEPRAGEQLVGAILREGLPYAYAQGPLTTEQARTALRCMAALVADCMSTNPAPAYPDKLVPAPAPRAAGAPVSRVVPQL